MNKIRILIVAMLLIAITFSVSACDFALTENQEKWDGDWYGWWIMTEVSGDLAELEGNWYDCCATLNLNADDTGHLSLWDELGSKDEPLIEIDVKIDSKGYLRSVDGFFMDCAIVENEWLVDSSEAPYENMIMITGQYADTDASFTYDIYLRKWGLDWADIEVDAPDLLPYAYYDWYLPLINDNKGMPALITTDAEG